MNEAAKAALNGASRGELQTRFSLSELEEAHDHIFFTGNIGGKWLKARIELNEACALKLGMDGEP